MFTQTWKHHILGGELCRTPLQHSLDTGGGDNGLKRMADVKRSGLLVRSELEVMMMEVSGVEEGRTEMTADSSTEEN